MNVVKGAKSCSAVTRGVQLEKTGTSPGASCNNKVTSPR